MRIIRMYFGEFSSNTNLRMFLFPGARLSTIRGADTKAQQLIQAISSALIRTGFGIVSGFGLGVGPYVLNGILEQLDQEARASSMIGLS